MFRPTPAAAGPRHGRGYERALRRGAEATHATWVDPRTARFGSTTTPPTTRRVGARPLAGLAAVALTALVVSCGGGSLESSTTTLPDGTEVSAQRYLADASAAAVAIRDFTATLDALGTDPTAAQMRAAANALAGPLSDAELAAQRLAAARLADARLEEQRAEAAARMRVVVTRMSAVVAAADAGRPVVLREQSAALAAAMDRLRAAGEASLDGA